MPTCYGITMPNDDDHPREYEVGDRTDQYTDFCGDCLVKIEREQLKRKHQERANKAVELLEEIAYNPHEHFIQALERQHRTNQQSIMKLFVSAVNYYAAAKPGQYDARNEGTVRMCKKIVELCGDDLHLGYI